MKLEPRHEVPITLMRVSELQSPGCWERLEGFREDRGRGLPDWPQWCWLPIAAGYSVATNGKSVHELTLADKRQGAGLGATLVGLSAWRVTKGVWDFDPDLYRELWETPIEGKIPRDLLYRLPEWCPYICLREPGMQGCFVWLESDANTGLPELRLMLVRDRPPEGVAPSARVAGVGETPDLALLPLALHLDAETVDEALQRAADEVVRQLGSSVSLIDPREVAMIGEARSVYLSQLDLVRHVLSLVLYLCSAEPDLTRRLPHGPGGYRKPVPRPAQQPTVWPVGIRIGAALRAAEQHERDEPGDPTGRTVRAHVRRAHWHCYWVGPRSEKRPGERLELRWVAPVAVGAGSAVATVRPVK